MAFKSTYDSKRSSSRRSSSSSSSYSSYSDDTSSSDSGACYQCAYYRTIKDPNYNYIFADESRHYCAYKGSTVEGLLHKYDTCSAFKRS